MYVRWSVLDRAHEWAVDGEVKLSALCVALTHNTKFISRWGRCLAWRDSKFFFFYLEKLLVNGNIKSKLEEIVCDRMTLMKLLFFSLFFEGGRERGTDRGRKTSLCSHLSRSPQRGPCLQPRNVFWLGLKLATLWFTGQHSVTELDQSGCYSFSI